MPVAGFDIHLKIDDKKLMKKMRDLSKQGAFKKSDLTKAMRPSAKAYQAKARALAPKDTGQLSRSIRVATLKGMPPVLSVRPEYRKRVSKKTGKVTSAGFHAHLVEFGTGPRKSTKGNTSNLKDGGRVVRLGGKAVVVTDTGSMPARPFLRPAWRQSKTRMVRLARVNFWKLVKRKARAK